MVDAYSNYPEVVQIPNQSSRVVIQAMKNIFSRHGIPKQVLSDNGPCYSSQEFKVFSKEWDFQHVTSSPRYPKSNGLAEKTVQTMKNIIRKCCAAGDDVQLGLLGLSPSELLMGRQLRNNLPSFVPDIKKGKRVAKDIIGWKHRQREKQKYYHDRTGVKSLPELGTNDQVRIRDSETGRYLHVGKIMDKVAPRSYIVQSNNYTVRRNRRDLLNIPFHQSKGNNNFSVEQNNEKGNEQPTATIAVPATNTHEPAHHSPEQTAVLRPRRHIVKPHRLIEEI